MQANELRIGNWVKSNIYQQVTIGFLEYLLNENFAPHEAFQPIPLTPEILEANCGYEKWVDYWMFEGFKLWHNGVGFYHINSELLINVDTVHQLQNLYFALTGEELQINL